MGMTADLITEALAAVYKQRDYHEKHLQEINEKITDYERVLKMIEDESDRDI